VIDGALNAAAHLRISGRVIRAIVRNPALRRVELAYLLFNSVVFGTWVAILLYAYEATGPATIGLVAVAQLIPAALVAPFAALVADRPDRVRSLAVGYLIQSLAVGATAAGILLSAAPIVVYAAAALFAISLTVTRPTQGALLPELSRTPEELSAANGLSGTVEGAGVFVGPLAAALILTVGGPGLVFAVGTLAILVAALLIVSLPRTADVSDASRETQADAAASEDERPVAAAAGGILDGLRALQRNGDIRLVVVLLGLRAVVIGALDVLFVLLALEVFHTGDPGAAILNGALGIGMVIGGAVSFVLIGRRRLAPALAVSAAALGGSLVVTAAFGTGVSAPFLIAFGGVGFAACDVAGRTILQRTAQDAVLGRVLGTLESIFLFGLAAGSIVAPVIAAGWGVEWALAIAGLLLPIAILIGWRGLAAIDRRTRVPERELALLRRSPIFAPLPPPELETVARRVRWLAVDPGTAVIVEGDPGDAYYLIDHGRLRVEQRGVTLRILDQPYEGFGEIALLRETPRTATVIADAPSVLVVVTRDDFLAAVTGSTPAGAAAERIIQTRF
jgi:MFS family permease